MIDLFCDYTQTKIAEARKAQAAGDGAGVAKAVHPIKSSAGNVGATKVQELSAQIEQAARQPSAGDLGRMLGDLENAFAEIKPKLEAGKKAMENEAA